MSIPPTPIPMENPGAGLPYGALEHAAAYLVVVQRLRHEGIGTFFVAVLIGLIGYAMFMICRDRISLSHAGQFIGGICFALSVISLLAASVITIIAPSRGVLLFSGLAVIFAILAISLFIPFYFPRMDYSEIMMWVIPMLNIIGGGVGRIISSFTNGALLDKPPLQLSQTLASNLLNRLRDASMKENPELIEVTWIITSRCLLLDDVAVLAQVSGGPFRPIREIRFLPPSDLIIETEHKKCFGSRNVKCKYQIQGKSFSGSISPESFARYEAWKARFPPPA